MTYLSNLLAMPPMKPGIVAFLVNRHAVIVLYLINGTKIEFIHPYMILNTYLGNNCHCCWYLGDSETVAKLLSGST
jgi:hypothetical protein